MDELRAWLNDEPSEMDFAGLFNLAGLTYDLLGMWGMVSVG